MPIGASAKPNRIKRAASVSGFGNKACAMFIDDSRRRRNGALPDGPTDHAVVSQRAWMNSSSYSAKRETIRSSSIARIASPPR